MSIVQEQLEELLNENNVPFQKISELGGDNFSIFPTGNMSADRLSEIINNKRLFDEDEVTYDDEEGDVIVHFEGIDDDSDSKSIKATDLVNQLKGYLKHLGIDEPDDIIQHDKIEFDLVYDIDPQEVDTDEMLSKMKESGLEPEQEEWRESAFSDDSWFINVSFDGTDQDGNALDESGKPIKSIRTLKATNRYIIRNRRKIKTQIKSRVIRKLRRKGLI